MLYLISPESIPSISLFAKQLEEIIALPQKPLMFQLRLKNQNNIEACIEAFLPICKKFSVDFILNDSLPLAKKYNTGVHVGKDTPFAKVQAFKELTNKTVGISCYNNLNRAMEFEKIADYISFGAVFTSKTKPNAIYCPQSVIEEFSQKSKTKIAIIGGISKKSIEILQPILPKIHYICTISEIWL